MIHALYSSWQERGLRGAPHRRPGQHCPCRHRRRQHCPWEQGGGGGLLGAPSWDTRPAGQPVRGTQGEKWGCGSSPSAEPGGEAPGAACAGVAVAVAVGLDAEGGSGRDHRVAAVPAVPRPAGCAPWRLQPNRGTHAVSPEMTMHHPAVPVGAFPIEVPGDRQTDR